MNSFEELGLGVIYSYILLTFVVLEDAECALQKFNVQVVTSPSNTCHLTNSAEYTSTSAIGLECFKVTTFSR